MSRFNYGAGLTECMAVVIVLATSAGFLFGDARTRSMPSVPHEASHGAARVLEVVSGPIIAVKPASVPLEAKITEAVEGTVADPRDESERPTLFLMLGELDAIILGVEAGRYADARELDSHLAGRLIDIRKAGGSVEDVDERLEKLFKVAKVKGFSTNDIDWLRTEADLQRGRFADAAR